MFSFAAKRVFGSAASKLKDKPDQSGGVNWQEFNFPPCIKVVHFDPLNDPIPQLAKKTVIRMKYCWGVGSAILAFNILTNIGLVAKGDDPSVVIFYSCLQFVVGSIAGGVVLYQGYRGIAGDLVNNSRIYLGCQSVLTVLMVVFACIQSGNIHGFAGITSRVNTASQPGYLILCILEGLFWMLSVAFSCYCMFTVWKYPGHDRASRIESDAKKSSSSSGHKRDRYGNVETDAEDIPPPRKKGKKSRPVEEEV